jgi:hypothetical protein
MSISDDVDPDTLISRLAGPLEPAARSAFRRAAEAALAVLPCAGEGIIYRTIAPLQRAFFDPPSDSRAGWDILQERGPRPRASARDPHFIRHLRPTR